jgi:hypothetical protein
VKLKTKLIAILATCLVGASIFSVTAQADKDVASLKALIKDKQAQFDADYNKMNAIQSKENQDVRNQLGAKTKNMGTEIRKLQLEVDPDDTENFAKQLNEAIQTSSMCVNEWKASADLKQAEEVQKRVDKLKKGKEEYQKNEKTVKQLRKELDIPVN